MKRILTFIFALVLTSCVNYDTQKEERLWSVVQNDYYGDSFDLFLDESQNILWTYSDLDNQIKYIEISGDSPNINYQSGRIDLEGDALTAVICVSKQKLIRIARGRISIYDIDEKKWVENPEVFEYENKWANYCERTEDDEIALIGEDYLAISDRNDWNFIKLPNGEENTNRILLQDRNHRLFVIIGYKIYRFDFWTKSFQYLTSYEGVKELSGLLIFHMVTTDNYLIADNFSNLVGFKLNGTEEEIGHVIKIMDVSVNNMVTSVNEDKIGRLWITQLKNIWISEDGEIYKIQKPNIGASIQDAILDNTHNYFYIMTDFGIYSLDSNGYYGDQ